MIWSDIAQLQLPFQAEILQSVLRCTKGEEWMVGHRCTVVEVFKALDTNTPSVLCELDYGLDIGMKLISLPLEHVRPVKPVTKIQVTEGKRVRADRTATAQATAPATAVTPDDIEL